ncbi:MAG: DEAD/DEAH box helicase family protein [Glaciecola sp.]
MNKLRDWQKKCVRLALDKYSYGQRHFLCLATPGAGKTIMASMVAKALLQSDQVDLVLCFSPSLAVSEDFRDTLSKVVGLSFDGRLGAVGASLCYHSMLSVDAEFWALFSHKRVFVIFDEIHHCAGQSEGNTNAWGQQILANIQDKAAFTLALTGTPWRSDNMPISLATYSENSSTIQCDFSYEIKDATDDGVCRLPNIIAIDSDSIAISKASNRHVYSSFSDVLSHSKCSYRDIIQHPLVIDYLLRLSIEQLERLKAIYPNSAGLIVAASVEHANQLINLLFELKQTAVLVTYKENKPLDTIKKFRDCQCDWIVSVGMVSEGTNIPRLRVCCYLSDFKTELYFRQVLGRVLRVQRHKHEIGYFFMPAHPQLVDYAQRINEDIPQSIFDTLRLTNCLAIDKQDKAESEAAHQSELVVDDELQLTALRFFNNKSIDKSDGPQSLDHTYHSSIDSVGRFREVIFEL